MYSLKAHSAGSALTILLLSFNGCKCGDEEDITTTSATATATAGGGVEADCVVCPPVQNGPDGAVCDCTYMGQSLNPLTFCAVSPNVATDQAAAQLACEMQGGTWDCDDALESCPGNSFPSYCSVWDPGSSIVFAQGVYSIDGALVSAIENEPREFINCDQYSTELLSGGGYEIGGIDSGDTLYELGLRNGDVPVELNGFPLDTYEDTVNALVETYGDGDTYFELEILRNNSALTLEYEILFTL